MTKAQRDEIAWYIKREDVVSQKLNNKEIARLIRKDSVSFDLYPNIQFDTLRKWVGIVRKEEQKKRELSELSLTTPPISLERAMVITQDYLYGRLPSQQNMTHMLKQATRGEGVDFHEKLEKQFFQDTYILGMPDLKAPKPSNQSYYTVIAGCRHMPFHDKEQWDADINLMRYLLQEDHEVDLILNGDILDMHSISRHMHKKKLKVAGLNLEIEYEQAAEALGMLDDLSLRNKTYMWGNHETWYWTYLSDIEKTKLGNLLPKPSDLLDSSWVKMEDYVNDYVMVGDLRVIHGVFVSIHAAKAHLDKFKGNIMFAHTHRMQQFTDSHGDNTITAYNIGWGGDKTAPVFSYMSALERSSWQQGIAVARTDESGHTSVQMLQWRDHQYVFGDKVITAKGISNIK